MRREPRLVPPLWLLWMAAVAGASVMAVELLGARMLSVRYGGSLHVWAAMISVTLLSLAVGYFVGGVLADRYAAPPLLSAIVAAAGLLIALCPHTGSMLRWCYHAFGLPWGALAGSAVVFALPLCLLGMVSPVVIRRLAAAGRPVGFTAGGVYALSTLGSVAGTLATGLWLIPRFGTATGFKIAALVTCIPAVAGLVVRYRYKGAAALLVPVAVVVIADPAGGAGAHYIAADGETVVVEVVRDSAQGRIAVMTKGEYRLLLVNGIIQTGVPLSHAHLDKGYCVRNGYFQGLIPFMSEDPASASVLIVGLAGGLTASMLQHQGLRVDCVDVDPAIVDVARAWFQFSGHVVIADGRRHLEDCAKRYDFCVIDTYSGDIFPQHMASREAFEAVKRVLNPKGVAVVHLIGAPSGDAFACVHRTLCDVFPHVRALKSEPGDDVQSLTIFASAAPLSFRRAPAGDSVPTAGIDPVRAATEKMTIVPVPGRGRVLTDAHNPIDHIRAEESVRWRQRTLEHIGEAAAF
jgi:spermidine synthase